MKSALSLFSTVVVLSGLSISQAADPWHHAAVSRLDQARPGAEGAAEAGPQKYLQIDMQYLDPSVLNNLDKFRVVDASGTEVGEYWGNDPKKGLIFESKSRWDSLNGLYLDGFGRREPLFQQVVAPAPAIVERPAAEYRDPYEVVPQRDVVVEPRRDDVYVAPRVVGDVDDRVVVGDGDVIVREGHDTVIDEGNHYVGGHRVDVYDDGDYGDHVVVHNRGHGGGYDVGGGGGGGDGYGGGSGAGYGKGKGKGKGKNAGKAAKSAGDDSNDSPDDVTIDDPTAGKAIAKATGINPDKANGSGDGSGDGAADGSGKGDGSGYGKDGKGDGSGSGDGSAKADGQGMSDGQGSGDGKGQDGQGDGKDGKGKDGQGQDSKPSASQDGQGKGDGSGQGDGAGPGDGSGPGDGAVPGTGPGDGPAGPGTGPGDGPGTGPGDGPGTGPGTGPGDGPGTGPGPGPGPGPGYGPGPAPGPGYGPGPGPDGGPGYGPGGPGSYGPYAYNPYRYRTPYNYNPYGYYAPYRYDPYVPNYQRPQYDRPQYKSPDLGALPPPEHKMDKTPELVLYVTAGEPAGPGKVYQVEGTDGRVLGKVNLPTTATGIDMYRDHGVVLASPREGGKILQIDDTGKLSTIIEKDPALMHPVKIAMPGNSDTMVVADDLSDQLVMSTIAGTKTRVYQKLDQRCSSQPMSVAVTNDKGVVFSSDAEPGVHKFMGDQSASGNKPLLPASGGVAADHSSLRWAAAQAPNAIKVYEGQQYMKSLRLPPNKKFYKGGLMSFGPDGSLCVAVQDEDNPSGDVWILAYQVEKDKITNSFKWTHEEMQDFAVGTRMIWEHNSPKNIKSPL